MLETHPGLARNIPGNWGGEQRRWCVTYMWYNSVELCSFVAEAFDPSSKLAEVASGNWTDGIEELQDDPASRFRIDRNIELLE